MDAKFNKTYRLCIDFSIINLGPNLAYILKGYNFLS